MSDESIPQTPAEQETSSRPRVMLTEDLFASVGHHAFQWLVRSVGTNTEAARVMGVGIATVTRWLDDKPSDLPVGRRARARSWKSSWFGYPSPLPAFDRVCERLYGKDFFLVSKEKLSTDEAVFGAWRTEGLDLSLFLEEETFLREARHFQIPPSSLERLWGKQDWPSQWSALDALSKHVVEQGWPEFVIGYQVDRCREKLIIPGLRCLTSPLLRKVNKRWYGR